MHKRTVPLCIKAVAPKVANWAMKTPVKATAKPPVKVPVAPPKPSVSPAKPAAKPAPAKAAPPKKTAETVRTDSPSVSAKPVQNHHFATNKHSKFTPLYNAILKKYKLDLNGDWNKQFMPHQGRHTNKYHDYVLARMRAIDAAAKGNKQKFLKGYEAMKKDIAKNPDILYKKK